MDLGKCEINQQHAKAKRSPVKISAISKGCLTKTPTGDAPSFKGRHYAFRC
ncbi:hypothetical protein JYQ62_13360 [Nostoc sp. UHCC 0702]|nr:hypothetical protein JYQ62_13360 [Nostoc sp. UHCC 0702]